MPSESRTPYFRRFLRYALDYKVLLALAIVTGVFKFAINYTFPWLIGAAIDEVIRPTAPKTTAERIDYLWVLVWLGLLFSVLHALFTYARGYTSAMLGSRIIADLRQDLFDHLHRLSLHFYSKERTGSIVSRLITDIQTASQIVNGGVVALVMDLFSMSLGVVLLLSISWKMTLACMAILPLYALTFKLLNPRVKRASAAVQSQISKISGNVQERLSGIALVKTYAAEGRERERFKVDTEEHYDLVLEQSTLSQLVSALSEGLVHIGHTIVIGLGGYLAVSGDLTPGAVVMFLGWLTVIYQPVRRFAEINVVYQTSLAAIERVFQVFDITPKIVEKPDGAIAQPPQRGEVRFEHVNFDYHDDSDESQIYLERQPPPPVVAELKALDKNATAIAARKREAERRWVLDGLDFVVDAGQRIALVGPSGSGKTTLVSLLPRLYDVSEGRITIDGVDVRDYKLRPLRRAIGIVQQDSLLLSGTIRENIVYGRPNATPEEVEAAAHAANAHEFISDLPNAYDARVGERGVNLSGGQRQRISIARALLKDPRILILDEATSALDSESEALVQEALDRLMTGRTCFIIAHRLSTVRHVDRILVMQAGHMIESGKHDELLERGGLYARLARHQFGVQGTTVRAGSPQAV